MRIRSFIVASLLAAGSIGAHAAETDQSSSTAGFGQTRAEVKAETLRALAAHEVAFGDVGYPVATPSTATQSRAAVKAETLQALAAGEVPTGERADPAQATATVTGPTRAEVKGEVLRAIAAHELHFSDTAYPDSGVVTIPRTRVRVPAASPTAATATGAPAS